MNNTIYISYSKKDKKFKEILMKYLIKCGFICNSSIYENNMIKEEHLDELDLSDTFILLLSNNTDCDYGVIQEYNNALIRNKKIYIVKISMIKNDKMLNYYFGALHWYDASVKRPRKYLKEIVIIISKNINSKITPVPFNKLDEIMTKVKIYFKARLSTRLVDLWKKISESIIFKYTKYFVLFFVGLFMFSELIDVGRYFNNMDVDFITTKDLMIQNKYVDVSCQSYDNSKRLVTALPDSDGTVTFIQNNSIIIQKIQTNFAKKEMDVIMLNTTTALIACGVDVEIFDLNTNSILSSFSFGNYCEADYNDIIKINVNQKQKYQLEFIIGNKTTDLNSLKLIGYDWNTNTIQHEKEIPFCRDLFITSDYHYLVGINQMNTELNLINLSDSDTQNKIITGKEAMKICVGNIPQNKIDFFSLDGGYYCKTDIDNQNLKIYNCNTGEIVKEITCKNIYNAFFDKNTLVVFDGYEMSKYNSETWEKDLIIDDYFYKHNPFLEDKNDSVYTFQYIPETNYIVILTIDLRVIVVDYKERKVTARSNSFRKLGDYLEFRYLDKILELVQYGESGITITLLENSLIED